MGRSLSTRLESRTAFVGVLLVGALVLTGLLGWHAIDAGRSHAASVQKTIGEQARFAAWEFAGNARDYLDSKILYPGLEIVAIAGGRDAGVELSMAELDALATEKEWGYAEYVHGIFRVDLTTAVVTYTSRRDPSPAETEAWLSSGLREHALDGTLPGWEPVMVSAPDGPGAFVYRLYPEERSEARLLYGYVMGPDGVGAPLNYAFEGSPLLPEGLTGGRANRDVFHVQVVDGVGQTIWSSDVDYASDWTASDTVGTRYAGLVAEVVVNPTVAPELVIGGLPRSRLPMIVTLLILTVGLVAGAFYQLRRETELAQLRADFVSGVSHELRTPLAQIRMFSETLLLGRVRSDEERQRSLEIIVNESRRLTHQVDNVLLYSRSERDGMRTDVSATDLGDLVERVAESFTPLALAHGSRVEAVTPGACIAHADGSLLRQALLNLLDNALKYGPAKQTIRVGSSVERQRVLLWVEDEGPGVPEEERARIWEPYFRRPMHRESAVAGSGIGLSVVRDVAEAHGGSARVTDGDDGGARFVIELPATVMAANGVGGGAARVRDATASPSIPKPAPATLRYGADGP